MFEANVQNKKLSRNWALGFMESRDWYGGPCLVPYLLRTILKVGIGLGKGSFVRVSALWESCYIPLQLPRFFIRRYETISECNNLMIQQIKCCKTRAAIIKSLEYWWQFPAQNLHFFPPTPQTHLPMHTHSQIPIRKYLT
jgi:hypothetical protein